MWDNAWDFIIKHYVFHTIIVAAVFFLLFGKYSSIKIGKSGLEVNKHKDGDTDKDKQQDKEIDSVIGKLKKIETLIEEETTERIKRNEEVDERLNGIKSEVSHIFSLIADYEGLQEKVSEGTLENMLFNDNVSTFKRLKAFKRLIAMKKNGRIREKGYKLILENKNVWLDVQEADLALKIVDQNYFNSVMDDIDKQIFRY